MANFTGEMHAEERYPKELAKVLNDFRKRNIMCDVVLLVGKNRFMAHRNVISAASPYFYDKLCQESKPSRLPASSANPFDDDRFDSGSLGPPSQGSQIEAHAIGNVIEDVLNFIYLGEVCVHQDNVRQLVAASDYLRMTSLKEISCRFYEKRLAPSNCLSISALADEFNCATLKQAADAFIFRHFADVSSSTEFKALNFQQLVHIIASDELEVDHEEQVFEAVMTWLHHDVESHLPYIYEVLSQVRFPLMSKYYIVDRVEEDDAIKSDPKCLQLIAEAKNYTNLPDRQHCYQGARFRPRKSLDLVNIIIASGGNQDRMCSREVLCYFPETDFWYPLAPMLHSRFGFTSVQQNNYIYAVGGLTEEGPTKAVERYNFVSDKWEELRPLTDPVYNHGSAVYNGEIYVIGGGKDDACLNNVFKFSSKSGLWEPVASLKVPRKGCTAVAHKMLYALGGYGPNGSALASVERFNPYYNEWAKIFPMNSSRAFASAICIGNKIYVFGGEYAMWSYYRTAEVFDIATDEWTNLADMSVPRAFMGISNIKDTIYVIGGMVSLDDDQFGASDEESFVDTNETNLVECYDITKNMFGKSCSVPVPTAGLCCLTVTVPRITVKNRCGL